MKVLQINSVCGIRSTGRICIDIADILTQNGHECKIAYGRETVPDEYKKYAVRIGSNLGVKIDALKSRIFDNAGFNSKRATKKFIKWVEEYDPDVIHLHNIHGYYINVEILFDYLKRSNKPVIWTLHDCWSFTGHCAHYTMANCYKWRSECFKCNRKKTYPKSFFLNRARINFLAKKRVFTSVDNITIVTPSEWLANEVRQSFLKKYSVLPIPNGIDLNLFKYTDSSFREEHNLQDKKIVLGVATAWEERKGLDKFLEISKILPDEYKVVLVGLSSDQISRMPTNILALSATNNVLDLCKIYSASDVFLNLGKEETMGLTTVEAMACGTPVVASNYTAVPEVVAPDGGIVIPDLEAETILSGINSVLSGDYLKTQNNAMLYEKNVQYNKYIALYELIQRCV